MNENIRFAGADWYSAENIETVVIGGAGGIGSWTTLALARANFNVILIDDDIIEEQNYGGQFFMLKQIENLKTKAIGDNINSFTTNSITTYTEKVTENTPTNEFMISAFDNMKARKDMFNVWKKSWDSMNKPLLIDGRLNMEGFQIFCVTPETAEQYEKELFEDSEVKDAPCSMQQTTHTAMMIASHITAFFTNHITNIKLREKIREIPFLYEYFIPINLTINRYE